MHRIHKYLRLSIGTFRLLGNLGLRVWTQEKRVLPDFFVLGPPRSGTSSLSSYLNQHPCYLRPFMKELGYRTDREGIRRPHGIFNDVLYRHLPRPLRSPVMHALQRLYFSGGATGYRKLFPLASAMKKVARQYGRAITGDYTMLGLYSSETTDTFPYSLCTDEPKFITILRNPVDVLFSFYTKEIAHYYRQINRNISFDQFVWEPKTLYGDGEPIVRSMQNSLEQWRPTFAQRKYFDEDQYSFATFMVSYVVFIKEWLNRLPRERFLIVSFQDFCERSNETMNCICDFLEIPRFEVPDTKAVNANEYDGKTVPEKTASCVREICRPYNEELYELLGRDLGWN